MKSFLILWKFRVNLIILKPQKVIQAWKLKVIIIFILDIPVNVRKKWRFNV